MEQLPESVKMTPCKAEKWGRGEVYGRNLVTPPSPPSESDGRSISRVSDVLPAGNVSARSWREKVTTENTERAEKREEDLFSESSWPKETIIARQDAPAQSVKMTSPQRRERGAERPFCRNGALKTTNGDWRLVGKWDFPNGWASHFIEFQPQPGTGNPANYA
jgi:hypothetical protein